MDNIDYKTIRTWSMLGQRGTFGVSLFDLAKNNTEVFGLAADLCKTSGMDRFANQFPDRFLNVGIAEQNMIGIAAGLADCGYIPFATTFSNFASLRANEQIRHFMAYMKSNVKLVGFGAGFAMELFGNTHYGLEDIAAVRAFPNLIILSPADCMEVKKCVEEASKINNPVYIRLTGKMNNPIVHKNNIDFEIGKNIVLKEGSDIIIFATGSMVYIAIAVADELLKEGISCMVVDVHTLKPFNNEEVEKNISAKMFVSIEEHSVIGGLGSIISDAISKYIFSPKLLKFGASDEYKLPGDYNYMLYTHGLTKDNIVKMIKNNI